MAENNFKTTVAALFEGMDGIISSKTVVGDAITIGDMTLIPLLDVSFALGAGSNDSDKTDKGSGGMGGKITPSAMLVIQNGKTKLVNIKNQDTVTKIIDLVPELVDKFTESKDEKITEDDVVDILENQEKKES